VVTIKPDNRSQQSADHQERQNRAAREGDRWLLGADDIGKRCKRKLHRGPDVAVPPGLADGGRCGPPTGRLGFTGLPQRSGNRLYLPQNDADGNQCTAEHQSPIDPVGPRTEATDSDVNRHPKCFEEHQCQHNARQAAPPQIGKQDKSGQQCFGQCRRQDDHEAVDQHIQPSKGTADNECRFGRRPLDGVIRSMVGHTNDVPAEVQQENERRPPPERLGIVWVTKDHAGDRLTQPDHSQCDGGEHQDGALRCRKGVPKPPQTRGCVATQQERDRRIHDEQEVEESGRSGCRTTSVTRMRRRRDKEEVFERRRCASINELLPEVIDPAEESLLPFMQQQNV